MSEAAELAREGIVVPRAMKAAAGRPKDMDDLMNLPLPGGT